MPNRQPVAAVLAPLLVAIALGVAIGGCGGGDQPDLAAFCEKLGVASGPEGKLASLAPNDPDAAAVAAKELEGLRRIAPLEIKPSLTTINDTVGLVLVAFNRPEGDGQQTLQNLESEMAAYAEAAVELADFADEHCGLRLNPDVPTPIIDLDRITDEVELDVRG